MGLKTPFAKPSVVKKDFASSLDIDDGTDIFEVATNLTGNLTLNLTNKNTEIPDGYEIRVKLTDDGGGNDVIFGTDLTGKTHTLTASATAIIRMVKYGGAYYVETVNEVS